MTTLIQRAYNSKDEELPVSCNFAVFLLKRDQADFIGYSPKFGGSYVTDYVSKIDSVRELIMPRSETLDLINITSRLYSTMDGLIDPINRVSGYLKLASGKLNVSAADFGLTLLRKNITSKNAEGVITSLRTVNNNLKKHSVVLVEQGLTPELTSKFTDAITSIAADNQKQYEIISNRKNIVQNNIALFNSLYEQMMEILNVGKILYKTTNAIKAQEYTFNNMLKQVRIVSKKATAESPVTTV